MKKMKVPAIRIFIALSTLLALLIPLSYVLSRTTFFKASAATGTLTVNTSSQVNTGTNTAAQFTDKDNTSYLLDPASTGTSLAVAGNVGIGTYTPRARLHVATDTTALTGKSALIVDQLESQDIFTASASGTTKFIIQNSGNVGIGKTPTSALDVSGTVNAAVFGTSTEKKSAGCSTASCTATATCTAGKIVYFGMKSTTSAACDTNYTNCSAYCGVGGSTNSCAATSTGSAASVVIYCAKIQ